MRRFHSILILILGLSICVFSQQITSKCVFIDSSAFQDEKAGIPELVNAYKQLGIEFKSQNEVIEKAAEEEEYVKTGNEIKDYLEKMKNFPTFETSKEMERKFDFYKKTQDQIVIKQWNLKSLYEKRLSETVQPIIEKISKSLKQFAERNGYEIIIDKKKINESPFSIFSSDYADITKEFIQFYNNQKQQ